MVKMTAHPWRAAAVAALSTLLLVALPAADAFEVQEGKLQSISSAGIAEHTATWV